MKDKPFESQLGSLLIYAARYAIGRHTYASAEVAQAVSELAPKLSVADRVVLTADIQKAFDKHTVDELSTEPWRKALNVLIREKEKMLGAS